MHWIIALLGILGVLLLGAIVDRTLRRRDHEPETSPGQQLIEAEALTRKQGI